MNKERLLNIAKALRESPEPDKFSMDAYMNPCGTPSCALGHYAVRADLQNAFTAHASPEAFRGIDLVGGIRDIHYDAAVVLEHFDITDSEADQLFADSGTAEAMIDDDKGNAQSYLALSAKTPNEAADWIERFVSEQS